MNDSVKIQAHGATDVGMKRRLNEDVYLVDDQMELYLVCDGMGGHAAGEVASRLAADEILRTLSRNRSNQLDTWPEHWNMARSADANSIVDAILAGHEKVTQAVSRDQNLKGMGTTVVAAIHPPGESRLIICHVGDSRAYRLRDGEISLLTDDHSWVHEQVSAGFLSEEAARAHPLKNVVTQALGGSSIPKVDILEALVEDSDLYLLCSDGLNSMLTDEEIGDFLRGGSDLDEMGRQLIVAANEKGGNDNISVVIIRTNVQDSD